MNSVPREVNEDWRQLWRLAERLAASAGTPATAVFEDLGLFVHDPGGKIGDGGYSTSPLGSACFGSTGGDGVHFSLLPPDASGVTPVVMTSPMAFDHPNIVVGGDLREFLALGCTAGYWPLEQLAYDIHGNSDWGRNAVIRRLQSEEPKGTEQDVKLLRALTAEFDLRPWPDAASQLAELDRRYSERIELDPRRS